MLGEIVKGVVFFVCLGGVIAVALHLWDKATLG